MSATLTPDRLTAVNLTDLSDDHMSALRREAIRRGVSMAELVFLSMQEKATQLVASMASPPKTTDIIRGAVDANRGHHEIPEPEALN